MNRDELLEKVRGLNPDPIMEKQYPDLFGKYGYFYISWYERYVWFEEENILDKAREKGYRPITDATNEELLEMWAREAEYEWRECSRKLEQLKREKERVESEKALKLV